jgi:hypothetical protein
MMGRCQRNGPSVGRVGPLWGVSKWGDRDTLDNPQARKLVPSPDATHIPQFSCYWVAGLNKGSYQRQPFGRSPLPGHNAC